MKRKPTSSAAAAKRRDRAASERRDLSTKQEHGSTMANLYHRAEARLQDQQKRKRSRASASESGPERLLHELEVHQIELEMQNAELQKARDDLEVALEKYTDLYDFAPVGYFSVGESGEIVEANLTGAALLGMERSRLINRRLPHFMPAANRPGFQVFLEKVFSESVVQTCEMRLLKEGGETFWASFRATPAIALKGTRKWCRVAVLNIAVRKQAEEVMHRNEALFSALVEQAPMGVYVVDDQMRLQQVNPRARPVFGKIHPLKGRDFSEIIRLIWPEKIANEIVARFRHTLKTGQPYYSPEFSERRRDTSKSESYEWQIQRITLPAGLHGVVCFFTDITERKRTEGAQRRLEMLTASNRKLEREIIRRQAVEQALLQSEQHQIELLEQSHHMQGQLRHLSRKVLRAQEEERKRISRELHDVIAQTLTGINVRLAALKKEAALNTKDLDRNIARTQRLVEHSVNIVHRFARELRPAVLDDLGLIPALKTFMVHFRQETGILVSLSAVAGLEPVHSDKRTVLYRVAQEALTNIARHAQAGRADVKFEKLDGTICMTIKDDGKGFQTERAFHGKKKDRLGLLGMRERVEMVSGNFTVRSAPGKGTTVLVQIPLATNAGGGRTKTL